MPTGTDCRLRSMRQDSMSRKKFGQLEMVGLVIIVIIVITALLIYLVYSFMNPSKSMRGEYVNAQVATRLVVSMTKTNVEECPQHTLGSLIVDCARQYRSFCGQMSTCDAANLTIHKMLYDAMPMLGKNFTLKIDRPALTFVNGCAPKREAAEGMQVLSVYPGYADGTSTMSLRICDEE
jgi:hypothetical protein